MKQSKIKERQKETTTKYRILTLKKLLGYVRLLRYSWVRKLNYSSDLQQFRIFSI